MATMIFVNLPVKDLNRSVEFFTKLGYTFNQQFTDENATCMVISDTIFAMLIVDDFFKTFTNKPTADATQVTETIVSLSADSREHVDKMVDTAIAAGAGTPKPPLVMDGMYGRSFYDLDGHHWEYMWMDPAMVQQNQPAEAAQPV